MKKLIEELRQAADVKPADCPELFEKAADAIESQAATIARYETTAENYELLQAKVDGQAREIERLKTDISNAFNDDIKLSTMRDMEIEIAALKSQPSGVVLPPHVNTGAAIQGVLQSIGIDGDVSYHLAGQLWNACLDEVARLNSSPASADPSAAPAPGECLPVPRELLVRLCLVATQDGWKEWNTATAYEAAKELSALLAQQGREVE